MMSDEATIKGTVNVVCRKCESPVMGVFYLPRDHIDIKCLECGNTLTEEVEHVATGPDNQA